jgi:hypothetical protein
VLQTCAGLRCPAPATVLDAEQAQTGLRSNLPASVPGPAQTAACAPQVSAPLTAHMVSTQPGLLLP